MRYKFMLIRSAIALPFIWIMIIPLTISDLIFEIYHRICFPLYGMKMVKRKNYIKIDRQKLKYLHLGDKLNCAYCGYANGLARYWTEILAHTEKHWCGIQHMKYKGFVPPEHHKEFLKYGDEKAFKEKFHKQ